MKDIVAFPVMAQATLGSLDDVPKRRVRVKVIRKNPLPGFYECVTDILPGIFVIHRDKIELEEK